ncbi:MAG: hypothetical protein KGZ63_05740 [Clostridiales bacterium]|nr:hypothetical protein [Clostridiales bacterium]
MYQRLTLTQKSSASISVATNTGNGWKLSGGVTRDVETSLSNTFTPASGYRQKYLRQFYRYEHRQWYTDGVPIYQEVIAIRNTGSASPTETTNSRNGASWSLVDSAQRGNLHWVGPGQEITISRTNTTFAGAVVPFSGVSLNLTTAYANRTENKVGSTGSQIAYFYDWDWSKNIWYVTTP